MATFNILPIETKIINATTSSSSVNFDIGANRQVRVYNAGSATAFIKFGKGTATAAVTDMAIPSGAIEVFDLDKNDTVAGITASSTATVYVTLCTGRG